MSNFSTVLCKISKELNFCSCIEQIQKLVFSQTKCTNKKRNHGNHVHFIFDGIPRSIPSLQSSTGKCCTSYISILTHSLGRGFTTPSCQCEVASVHSCHSAHLVVVVGVLGGGAFSHRTSVVERQRMVGQLWVLAY